MNQISADSGIPKRFTSFGDRSSYRHWKRNSPNGPRSDARIPQFGAFDKANASWRSGTEPKTTDELPNATIIVGEANLWMRPFHDRMPVILDWRDAGAWMAGESPGALLRPAPDEALREWIVSKRVNKAGAGDDDPALVEPIVHA